MTADLANPVVVVGAGLAGWTVIKELRRRQPDRPITLVTTDDGAVYSKPMLSNAIQLGRSPQQLAQAAGEVEAVRLGVTLLARTEVLAIDRPARQLVVRSANGEQRVAYGQLVLALGARPIRLPLEGAAEAVFAVNHLHDYERWHAELAARVQPGAAVAVLGAGLIGVEFADDLLRLGAVPHVFDLAPQPLGRLLPAEPATHLRERLAAAGVVWHLADPVVAVEREANGLVVTTRAGERVAVAAALSAVGLQPQTALAESAGLTVARGVVVDDQLRTSDAAIFAVGDCAAYPGAAGPQPLPFVLPLMNAARTLASVLTGEDAHLQFPVMPVVVKTPSCPVVVAPPAPQQTGTWQTEPLLAEAPDSTPLLRGTRALFHDQSGALRGFALTGDATAERQQWQKRMAA